MQLLDGELRAFEKISYEMRKDILKMCYACGNQKGHLGGCMSTVEILAVLYTKIMNLSECVAGNVEWSNRDRFVMSKGHAGIALYAALRQAGVLSVQHLNQGIRGENTILYRHPKYNPSFGIECSVGSLGMGAGYAAGLAEAAKRLNRVHKIYVMLGDGECGEGAIWEALSYASHKKLDNLCVIVDKNGLQLDGKTSDVLSLDNFYDKFVAFGFQAIEIDGHDYEAIYSALSCEHKGKPLAIIANTIKGKGISFAENRTEWHDNFLSDELYFQALEEIKAHFNHSTIETVNTLSIQDKSKYETETTTKCEMIPRLAMLGSRNSVGFISELIAETDKRFCLVFSDCANRIGIQTLIQKHGEMCYQMGIAEQNQLMVAAALALEGFKVYAIAYAPFITARVMDQIRSNLGYMNSPVKLIGLAAGFAASDLGATHTALEDIANMRGIPNMTVICPADNFELYKTMMAIKDLDSPAYIRITAEYKEHQQIYRSEYKFVIGEAVTLHKGEDITIIGCGTVLHEVMKAAEILEKKGISCDVINMHTVKPLDVNILASMHNKKLVITVEEHSIIGGLGSAIAEYMADQKINIKLVRIGVPDCYYVADLPEAERMRARLYSKQIEKKILEEFGHEC
jgi:transketolase C-terminal domain/subunit/transketolase N-terminal domain/subunit